MIGAIKVLKQSPNTSWMDDILAPCSRREAWLAFLAGHGDAGTLEQVLDQGGKDWLLLNVNQTELAVNIISRRHAPGTQSEYCLTGVFV